MKTLCSKRLLRCKYCECEKVAHNLTEHELSCGLRFENCPHCGEAVALREWDTHQARFHGLKQRRFRDRSVVSNAHSSGQNGVFSRQNSSGDGPMLPCEFCDGMVEPRKLLAHQAECVNPTNVRRSSVTSLPSRKSSSASSTQLGGGGGGHTRMSRHDEHKMDQKAKQEDKVDPDMIPCEFCGDMQYEETIMRHQRHCSSNPRRSAIEVTQVQTYDATSLRRSQARRNYSLSRTNSFRERSVGAEEAKRSVRQSSLSRQSSFSERSYTFGRSDALPTNSTFSRLGRPGYDYTAATRRTNLFDGYTGFAIYSSISQGLDEITYGVGRRSRRSSITGGGGAGDSYYSSSRRGSVTSSGVDYAAILAAAAAVEAVNKATSHNATQNEDNSRISSSCSRTSQKAESGLGASPKLSRNDSSRLSNDSCYESATGTGGTASHKSPDLGGHQMSSGGGSVKRSSTMTTSSILSRQESLNHSGSQSKLERKVSFHTTSDHDRPVSKLERVDSQRTASAMSSDSGTSLHVPGSVSLVSGGGGSKKEKKSSRKEKDPEKEARREERRKRKEKRRAEKEQTRSAKEKEISGVADSPPCAAGDLLNQVSEKLKLLEIEQLTEQQQLAPPSVNEKQQLAQLPSSSLLPDIMSVVAPAAAIPQVTSPLTTDVQGETVVKATVSLGSDGNCLGVVTAHSPEPKQSIQSIDQDQPSYFDDEVDDTTVVLREKKPSDDQDGQQTSKDGINNKQQGSKRNSLDSKTVQGLAQDLAAECAKAYALMENSLTKFSSDFGPFGMNQRGRKSKKNKEKAAQ